MKYLLITMLAGVAIAVHGQNNPLKRDESLAIPIVNFNDAGDLVLVAAPTSSREDFDFLIGKWKLKHRKLRSALTNSRDWEEFETEVEDARILGGTGNMDIGHALRNGTRWEGRTVRLFDPKTRLWSLYWATSNSGILDPPVVGSFENGVGHFFGKDILNGKNIIVLFRWDARDKEHSKWSQAFSPDNGKTWEWNWFNVKERIAEPSQKEIAQVNFAIPLPKLNFDAAGELVIAPSATSSAHDFDFLVGKWKMKHRKLKTRLNHSNEWEEFETVVEDYSILEGMGNLDIGYATFDGKPWEGRTIRLFDPKTRLWRLYWVTSATGVLDPPVVGSFENGIGHFFCKDISQRNAMMIAFSPDNGKTWEWNWLNTSYPQKQNY